jgi:hypothetical protein
MRPANATSTPPTWQQLSRVSLLTGCIAAAFSLGGLHARHSYGLSVRFAVLDSHFHEKKLDLDRVKSTQAADGIRLASTENAIQSTFRRSGYQARPDSTSDGVAGGEARPNDVRHRWSFLRGLRLGPMFNPNCLRSMGLAGIAPHKNQPSQ